jgi:hypothetical protein
MIWPLAKLPFNAGSREDDAISDEHARFFEDEKLQLSAYSDALKEMITAGADVDEIENAFGNFGLILTNPIPVNGPIGEVIYLSSLRQLGKTKILFHRIGSIDGFDVFESVSVDGKTWDIFYLDMFHPRKSKKSPKGYSIVSGVSSFCGVNIEVQNFPYGLSDAIATYSQAILGIPMDDPDIRQAEEKIGFVRPDPHIGFMEDLRAGNFQKDPMSRRSG